MPSRDNFFMVGGIGGAISGACSSLLSLLHGSSFTSDWADSGLAPAWHQKAEAATSDPAVSFLRIRVCHHNSLDNDEVLAIAVVT